jgi:hypothetical protein
MQPIPAMNDMCVMVNPIYMRGARGLSLLSAPISSLQAYKNGVQGLSMSAVGLLQLSDLVMGDNGAGPRSLTIYNLTGSSGLHNNGTANSSGSATKLVGGNVEFSQVRNLNMSTS